jgi:hypothetical protein
VDLISCGWKDKSWADLTLWAAQFVAQDFLATLMSRKDKNSAAILELAGLVRGSVGHCADEASKPPTMELFRLVDGVAGLVQTTPITGTDGIQSLLALRSKDNELINSLSPILQDAFWTAKMTEIWPVAAAESAAAPQLNRLVSLLRGDAKDVEEAWPLLEAKLEKWRAGLRPGAAEPILHCAAEAAARMSASLPGTPASVADLQLGETWRARVTWLQSSWAAGHPKPLLREAAALEQWLEASTAIVKLADGLALLPTLRDGGDAAHAAALRAFQDCRGLRCAPADTAKVEEAFLDAPCGL